LSNIKDVGEAERTHTHTSNDRQKKRLKERELSELYLSCCACYVNGFANPTSRKMHLCLPFSCGNVFRFFLCKTRSTTEMYSNFMHLCIMLLAAAKLLKKISAGTNISLRNKFMKGNFFNQPTVAEVHPFIIIALV